MEKTSLFIKESLRLFNSSPGMFPRRAVEENEIFGIKIPKETIIQVAWNTVNYNEDIYP